MTLEQPSSRDRQRKAEEVLLDALEECGTLDAEAIERLCAAHPDLDGELRSAHGGFLRVRAILGEMAGSGGPERQSDAGLRDGDSASGTPERLGRFELRGRLGRGGMGVVFRAFDPQVGREVALKVMNGGVALESSQRERFRREVRAVARLHHPGIVPVYEVGDEGAVTFYVMELVEGASLLEVLARLMESRDGASGVSRESWASILAGDAAKQLPADEPLLASDHSRTAARLALRVAEALAHAHTAGIVHRDVKPGNVMVARDGRVLLLDFGLARLDEEATLTLTGGFLGTPYYAPPERIRGDEIPGDPRGDVYSLGVTLYELLTFTRPFVGRSREQILRQIVSIEPAPPRTRNAEIPADLETIVLKAIEKEPRQRYADAGELAEDLQRFLDGQPILARRTGWLERLSKWVRREPALAALGAVLVVGTLVILVGTLWYGAQLRLADDALTERERVAALNLYQADLRLASQAADTMDWWRVEDLLERQRPKPGDADLRGFEWRCLWNRGHRGVTFQTPPLARATAMALSPDETTLALGGEDGEIVLWDTQAAKVIRRAMVHEGPVDALAFSSDGRALASGGSDRRMVVHDADLMRTLATLGPFVGRVVHLQFSSDATRLAAASGDYFPQMTGEVRVWDARSWQEIGGPYDAPFPTGVVFLPDELVAVASNNRVLLIDLARDEVVRTLDPGVRGIQLLACGSESFPLASAVFARNAGSVLVVWDSDYAVARRIPTEPVGALALSPDKRRLAAMTSRSAAARGPVSGGISLLEFPSLERLAFLEGANPQLTSLAFSSAGRRLVSLSPPNRICLWEVDRLAPPAEYAMPLAKSLSLSADGRLLAASSNDGRVGVWDLQTGEEALSTTMPTRVNTLVRITPDGRRVFAASYDDMICLDRETGVQVWAVDLGGGRGVFDLSPDGSLLAQSWDPRLGRERGVVLRDAATGAVAHELSSKSAVSAGLAFAAKGDVLAFADARDGQVRLWNWRTMSELPSIETGRVTPAFLALSSDGRWLACSAEVVSVWDVTSGEVLARLRVYPEATGMGFVDQERRLVVCSPAGRVSFWDTSTWEEVAAFQAHAEYCEGLAIARDAPVLATGAFDGWVRMWWAY